MIGSPFLINFALPALLILCITFIFLPFLPFINNSKMDRLVTLCVCLLWVISQASSLPRPLFGKSILMARQRSTITQGKGKKHGPWRTFVRTMNSGTSSAIRGVLGVGGMGTAIAVLATKPKGEPAPVTIVNPPTSSSDIVT